MEGTYDTLSVDRRKDNGTRGRRIRQYYYWSNLKDEEAQRESESRS